MTSWSASIAGRPCSAAPRLVRKLAQEIVARPSLDNRDGNQQGRDLRHPRAHGHRSRRGAGHLLKAQEAAKAKGDSPARYLLAELPLRLRRRRRARGPARAQHAHDQAHARAGRGNRRSIHCWPSSAWSNRSRHRPAGDDGRNAGRPAARPRRPRPAACGRPTRVPLPPPPPAAARRSCGCREWIESNLGFRISDLADERALLARMKVVCSRTTIKGLLVHNLKSSI